MAPPTALALGGSVPKFFFRTSPMPNALAIGGLLCVLGMGVGVPLGGPLASMIACGAILAMGLPHGTLDLDLFRQTEQDATRLKILLLYLGFASLMTGSWIVSPVVAFALFYGFAVVHFSEDWMQCGSVFLAQGMALAMLAIPSLTHGSELNALFAVLTGPAASTVFVDLLRLVSPVAVMVAVVTIGLLWTRGARSDAVSGGISLTAMAILPPIVGFALFFCLFHSPRHLRASLDALTTSTARGNRRTIIALTLAAAGLAAIVYIFGERLPASDRMISASFITLSILTLPHLAVPIVLRAMRPSISKPSVAQTASS